MGRCACGDEVPGSLLCARCWAKAAQKGLATAKVSNQEASCLFCDRERQLKPGCQKQRWLVCNEHCMVTCPVCGHQAFWLEKQHGRGGSYACFSLVCHWMANGPPELEGIGMSPDGAGTR